LVADFERATSRPAVIGSLGDDALSKFPPRMGKLAIVQHGNTLALRAASTDSQLLANARRPVKYHESIGTTTLYHNGKVVATGPMRAQHARVERAQIVHPGDRAMTSPSKLA